jgi:beta-aspartyl-peptidase (threonine type)
LLLKNTISLFEKKFKMYSIAIHGGAGTIDKALMTSEKEKAYNLALQTSIAAGEVILKNGGTALDAVSAAVCELENQPLFNAGRGSVFNASGKNEMDASIMDGNTMLAGAVAGIWGIKNPILLAKEIMLHSEHVMMMGNGALEFAKQRNFEFLNDDYFFTEARYLQLLESQKSGKMQLDHADNKNKKGTVGAVAKDIHGNIAAATSTGGMTNKKFGRVGDTPIIGSGCYANNSTCAISCTGHGEFFIRQVVAYDISCLMEYKNLSLYDACTEVVKNKLVKTGGEGGLIGVNKNGEICFSFNSLGMYRASKKSNEDLFIGIFE